MCPQASNEPDVYETSDLPEDDQAQFESVSFSIHQDFLQFLLKLSDLFVCFFLY